MFHTRSRNWRSEPRNISAKQACDQLPLPVSDRLASAALPAACHSLDSSARIHTKGGILGRRTGFGMERIQHPSTRGLHIHITRKFDIQPNIDDIIS